MATTNSALSFQGLSSGIQTDALVNAILAQEGTRLKAFQARQTQNQAKTSSLTSMGSALTALSMSLSSLKDKLNARAVTSSDSTGAYVSATASAAVAGNYEVKVQTVATRARISGALDGTGNPTSLGVTDTSAAIFSGGQATFAIQGTDKVIKTVTVTNNSLLGLRDAINASGAGVTATIINNGKTGNGAVPYQLVLTSNTTGTGSTGGVITVADVTNNDGSSVNSLGITGGTVDSLTTPTTLGGGLTSNALGSSSGVDAVFTLNGVQLTRQSNTVTDAVDGVTFTLKQGGQTGTTTLTVAQDKGVALTAVQDMISKYNVVVKAYKEASTATKNADGSIKQAPLTGEATSAAIIRQLKSSLSGDSSGLSASAYQRLAGIGINTSSDGTLTLDTVAFQTAMDKDPSAVQKLFTFSGTSTNNAVTVKSGTSSTATGNYSFNITSYDSSGNFSGTLNGVAISGSNGVLVGTGALSGLTLAITGTGSGTLSLARGAGQIMNDLITGFTGVSGGLSSALNSITNQNSILDQQIEQAQAMLDRRKKVLQKQFSDMEVKVAQLRSAASGLGGA